MSAIQASSAGVRDMADGSLRITLEFEPRHAKDAYALFGQRGTPVAVAALTQQAAQEQAQNETIAEEKQKGGALAQWAALRCKENSFFEFIRPVYDKYMGGNGSGYGDGVCGDLSENEKDAEEFCRHAILVLCGVDSRAELDTDKYAKIRFDELIRLPYMAWMQGK